MIKDIEFKDYDGYLQANIDNQTLSLPLKEIIKDKTSIINLASTGIPLYTEIPIHIKITGEKNNIEQGLLNIKIYEVINEEKKILLYEKEDIFINGEYKTIINNEELQYLSLGQYLIKIEYLGNKYFESSQLQYFLTIEKRELLFVIPFNSYHGKPYEDIDIYLQIHDSITKAPITFFPINYKYNDINYITKSDSRGYINFQINIADKCESEKIIVSAGFQTDIYAYNEIEIPILTDKLETEITNDYTFDLNKIILRGNVFAYNGDTMYNAKYGEVELYIEDEIVDTCNVENGIFELTYNYQQLMQSYQNNLDTNITEQYSIDSQMKFEYEILKNEEGERTGEVKFIVQVVDENNIPIRDGMVYFELGNHLNSFIQEVNNNGEAICYFYVSKNGKYEIKYRYYGIFEYKDSKIEKKQIEVS